MHPLSAQIAQLLEQAGDPTTKSITLYHIFLKVRDASVNMGIFGSTLWDGTDIPSLIGHQQLFLEALGRNPNSGIDILQYLAQYIPHAVLENPMLPILIFDGTWHQLGRQGIQALRSTAFALGHDRFPVFSRLCRSEWQVHMGTMFEGCPSQDRCGDSFCAICYPVYAETNLIGWRARRPQEA